MMWIQETEVVWNDEDNVYKSSEKTATPFESTGLVAYTGDFVSLNNWKGFLYWIIEHENTFVRLLSVKMGKSSVLLLPKIREKSSCTALQAQTSRSGLYGSEKGSIKRWKTEGVVTAVGYDGDP